MLGNPKSDVLLLEVYSITGLNFSKHKMLDPYIAQSGDVWSFYAFLSCCQWYSSRDTKIHNARIAAPSTFKTTSPHYKYNPMLVAQSPPGVCPLDMSSCFLAYSGVQPGPNTMSEMLLKLLACVMGYSLWSVSAHGTGQLWLRVVWTQRVHFLWHSLHCVLSPAIGSLEREVCPTSSSLYKVSPI